jgi:tetratricopeptide (TPR) repeat protein
MKSELLDLLKLAEAEIDTLAAHLTPAEREDSGTPEKWTPKMHLAHCAEWARRMLADLQDPLHPQQPQLEIDDENHLIYNQYRNHTWQQVIDLIRQIFDDLGREFERLSDEDMQRLDILPRQHNRPFWRHVVGNFFAHVILHLTYIYIDRGEIETALRLAEESTPPTLALDASPDWQGTTLYNLACNYALAGNISKALALLTQGLMFAPELSPWAREDPDLKALHGLPEFESLVNSQA